MVGQKVGGFKGNFQMRKLRDIVYTTLCAFLGKNKIAFVLMISVHF